VLDVLKFLHVAALFFWIACLLMVSRQLAWKGEKDWIFFKRLYFSLEFPAMCLTLFTGLLLLLLKGVNWKAPWLHMKMTFVAILVISELIVMCKLMKRAPGYGLLGYKILYWVIVSSLLGTLAAIYIMKPKFL